MSDTLDAPIIDCSSCSKRHRVILHDDTVRGRRYYICPATENKVDLVELAEG